MKIKDKIECIKMNKIGKYLIYILIILSIAAFFFLYWYFNNQFNAKSLASLNQKMTNPSLLEIKTKNPNNKWMESQYLIIDDDNKSHVEIFYPKNNKINILPKSNLNGDFQNYLPLLHTLDKFISFNIVKENNNDICGIEIFDINANKWQRLKTIPVLRNKESLPSFDVIYTKTHKPLLLIWGGINYKTGKTQNTIEIIDILNDKLLEKASINFQGGKIVQLDNECYLIGAKNITNNQNNIEFKEIKINILPFAYHNFVIHEYFKIYANTLSSSLDRISFLAIEYKNKQLTEYEMPNNIDNLVKINEIIIPEKYNDYSLINSAKLNNGVLLILKNNVEQLMVLFENTQNAKQGSSFDYRFRLLKKISPNIDLTGAFSINNANGNKILIYIQNNKLYGFRLKNRR